MEWVWKVFLAGFLATGTCGAPFVEETPPENPPGDMMKKPDPTPPKPTWKKVTAVKNLQGSNNSFRKIVGSEDPSSGSSAMLLLQDYQSGSDLGSTTIMRYKGGYFDDLNPLLIYANGKSLNIPDVYMFDYNDVSFVANNLNPGNKLLSGEITSVSFEPKDTAVQLFEDTSPCVFESGQQISGAPGRITSVHRNTFGGENATYGTFEKGKTHWCRIFFINTQTGQRQFSDMKINGTIETDTKQVFIGDACNGGCNRNDGSAQAAIAIRTKPSILGKKDSEVPFTVVDRRTTAFVGIATSITQLNNETAIVVIGKSAWYMNLGELGDDAIRLNSEDIAGNFGDKYASYNPTCVFVLPSGDFFLGGEKGKIAFFKSGDQNPTIHSIPDSLLDGTDRIVSVFAWSSDFIYALTDKQLYVYSVRENF